MLFRTVLIIASIIGVMNSSLFAGKSFGVTNDALSIWLGDKRVRIELSSKGQLLSIEDMVTNTSILAESSSNVAWSLDYANKSELDSSSYPDPAVKKLRNRVVFRWSKMNFPTIIGTVNFDPVEGQFLFSVRVKGQKKIISRITFPGEFSLAKGAGNYLLVSADAKWDTTLKPLDSIKSFSIMYPGSMQMQMSGFKIGDSAFLAYTNDDKGNVKTHSYAPKEDYCSFKLRQFIWLKPGQQWNSPYDVVIKVIPKGGYNELADEYGRWARKQWWAKVKTSEKIRKTPLLKRYFENGIVRLTGGPPVCDSNSFRLRKDKKWEYIENNKYSKYEPYYDHVINQIPRYEQAYDIKPGYWYPVWSGHQFDSQFPDYFPVGKWMGNFEKFHQAIEDNRWPMMYHINPAIWSMTTRTAKNSKYYSRWKSGYNFVNSPWSNVKHVLVSPGVTLPVEMRTIRRLTDKTGVNGLYMDVIGHGFSLDDNPLSEFSKYPNGYQLAKINLFKKTRSVINGPLMTEGRNEIILPYMDMGTGANGHEHEDEIPLWELVYGDCVGNVTYGIRNKQLRYYTWMLGGIQNMRWEALEVKGKIIPVYLTSSQQKVVSHVVPEKMERFDRLGECSLSQWKSGIVLWHRESSFKPADINTETTLGRLNVKQLASNGIVILTSSRDFVADSVGQIVLNEKNLFKCNPAQVSITRAGKRWVIHNEQKKAVKLTIQVASDWGNTASLSGKMVMSGQKCQIQPVEKDGWITINVKISPNECLVLRQSELAE